MTIRTTPSAALLAVVLACSASACAPTPVVRLAGDPPQAEPLTTAHDGMHPAADGVRRYVDACRAGRWEMAWDALSKQTRMALTLRARPAGARGIDLLRPLPTDADPGLRQLHLGDALARFVVADARSYEVPTEIWPVDQRYDGRRLETDVKVTDAAGKIRAVRVAFEDAGWRVHNPKLENAAGEATP